MRQIDELLNYGKSEKSEKSEPEKSKPKLKALLEEVLLPCVVPTCGLNLSICIAPMFKDALGPRGICMAMLRAACPKVTIFPGVVFICLTLKCPSFATGVFSIEMFRRVAQAFDLAAALSDVAKGLKKKMEDIT